VLPTSNVTASTAKACIDLQSRPETGGDPTADGRWAYTLYARQGRAPFVHALDTVKREAYCTDLPLRLSQQRQMTLRLGFRGANELRVRIHRKTLAVVDMDELEARKASS
jgi:hypothetical protein